MKSKSVIAGCLATVTLALGAGAAQAETIYELGRVNGEIFAYNPSELVDADADVRVATQYIVHASHLADRYVVAVDCRRQRVQTRARTIVRSDLTTVRDATKPADWTKPNRKAIGGILIKAVCAYPAPPKSLKRAEAVSMQAYMQQAADEVLSVYNPAKQSLVIDQTTVGNCIFAGMDQKISIEAMTLVQSGKSPAEAGGFRAAAAKLGAKCNGRQESEQDTLIVGASMAIFQRYGIIALLAQEKKIGEAQLAAAWNRAPAEVRAPLLARAEMLHDPDITVEAIESADSQAVADAVRALSQTPELKAAMAGVDHLNEKQKDLLLSLYFSASAMGEVAEARLAAS